MEFPFKYFWNGKIDEWLPRRKIKIVSQDVVLPTVPVQMGEIFYLRVLLLVIRGPTCFEDIRTIEGILYPTFKDACFALGLFRVDDCHNQMRSY